MNRRSALRADPKRTEAWVERHRERARRKAREASAVPGGPSSCLAPVSKRRIRDAEGRGEPLPASTLRQRAPRRRSPTEAEIASAWHEVVCAGRFCVKADCDQPAPREP